VEWDIKQAVSNKYKIRNPASLYAGRDFFLTYNYPSKLQSLFRNISIVFNKHYVVFLVFVKK